MPLVELTYDVQQKVQVELSDETCAFLKAVEEAKVSPTNHPDRAKALLEMDSIVLELHPDGFPIVQRARVI